jgi:predicted DNA binding CopG/RHH family protein
MKAKGRPTLPAGKSKVARVDLRVLPADKAAWQAKAAAAGLTLQAWIERALGRAR